MSSQDISDRNQFSGSNGCNLQKRLTQDTHLFSYTTSIQISLFEKLFYTGPNLGGMQKPGM